MYRALYAHKSKLPKYLSFEAGDKFTLIDTSVSDQWFLAQNGLGQIGYVPFNYIKKIEATTDQQVKFIDGAIEAIHLQAGADGSYTQEQRLCLKKLVKHRSDVIKRATLREKSPKGASKRRPAPAPPVEKSISIDACGGGERPSNLAVVGRSATISTVTSTDDHEPKKNSSKVSSSHSRDKSAKQNRKSDSKTLHRSSVASDTLDSNVDHDKNDVRKSRSVTSSIGQAPSVVSSASSMSTDVDADSCSEKSAELKLFNEDSSRPDETSSKGTDEISTEGSEPSVSESNQSLNGKEVNQKPVEVDVSQHSVPEVKESGNSQCLDEENVKNDKSESQTPSSLNVDSPIDQSSLQSDFVEPETGSLEMKSNDICVTPQESASLSLADDPYDVDEDDLPPPPADLHPGCAMDDEYLYSDYAYSLPPAPDDMMTGAVGGHMEESGDSDSLDLPAAKAIRECSCDDVQPKFDPENPFYASGSLSLPEGRQMQLGKREKRDVEAIHRTMATSTFLSPSSLSSSPLSSSTSSISADVQQFEKELVRLERLQAYLGGIQVTHADCEEMIGQFQHVSNLSHDESHWALLSAMSLFADNLPHLKPSLEILALRFKMAHQCPSTGKGYQCEDARTLESLVSQLDSVANDSQQRGHYLEDDLGDIIDIITSLSETLSKAKQCVSVAAIQSDNYTMIEVIAKYYQMETRWLIHSCLLQLVETICHLHPQAITEFLYSQLPLDLVAEMQQNSHDDVRFLQVARALGILFMRGKASPHRLAMTMDLHFFIWLLGMIEGFSERCRHDDVEMLVALVCSYHLQHRDDPQNPVTEALKMAHGHALLECALSFLSKHDDPTRLLNSGVIPKLNCVILLLTHLFDSSDTSDLLYTNDVDVLVGIFEEVFRDLSTGESLHRQMLKLLSNFLRCYPDTVSIKSSLSSRLGPLLQDMKDSRGLARNILENNRHIFYES